MTRYILLFFSLLLIACDSGDIYPEEKKIEEMNLHVTLRPETVSTNHTTLTTLDADDDIDLIKAWIMNENE